ncbi:MAG TPA: hypothetical protein PL033_17160 [Candidatus Brocadiia bacterium]|nr:hypothetical protein [Candidatus Brocadiia bacterium]
MENRIDDRQLMCLIVDDPCPGYNPSFFHLAPEPHPRMIPGDLIHRVADLFDEFGVMGKFSLIPYPMGQGRIDRHVRGVWDEVVVDFVSVARDRIAERFDITPEILTHWNAVDIRNPEILLNEREDVYFAHIDCETMTAYIALSLNILLRVGIDATGVTSPWALGGEREDFYIRAILEAQKLVNGRKKTWYFLHIDTKSPSLDHRVAYRSDDGSEWVVSIVSGGGDFIWDTQKGAEPRTDDLISADGKTGRLVELAKSGCPITFHTHWQSINSGGSRAGLAGLRDLFGRINKHMSDRYRWAKCSELARQVAEGKA